MTAVFAFNPDQVRVDRGRWGTGLGTVADGSVDAATRLASAVTFEFDEALHPRGAGGRWGSGGSAVDPVDVLRAAAPVPTDAEKTALFDYTFKDAYPINDMLRGGDYANWSFPSPQTKSEAEYQARTAALTGYLERSALPVDTVAYRAVEGTWIEQAQVGDTLTDPGFMSTSAVPGRMGGEVVLEIHAPAGTKAAYIGAYSKWDERESELLFQRGTTYRIDSDSGPGMGRTMVVTVTGQG